MANLLLDGDVLISGGNHGGSISSAELYDPSSGTFSVTASMNTPRQNQTSVLLNNGDVLVTGGFDGDGGNCCYQTSAELYH
jgi:hypothetical protein